MLCLTRKVGETIRILHKGETLTLTIMTKGVGHFPVLLGFTAPRSFEIVRGELIQQTREGGIRRIER